MKMNKTEHHMVCIAAAVNDKNKCAHVFVEHVHHVFNYWAIVRYNIIIINNKCPAVSDHFQVFSLLWQNDCSKKLIYYQLRLVWYRLSCYAIKIYCNNGFQVCFTHSTNKITADIS